MITDMIHDGKGANNLEIDTLHDEAVSQQTFRDPLVGQIFVDLYRLVHNQGLETYQARFQGVDAPIAYLAVLLGSAGRSPVE
jgi:hypothetical protein